MKQVYNDSLDADQQVTMEERIASTVCEGMHETVVDYIKSCHRSTMEAMSASLGREILLMVITEFRPDLLEGNIVERDEFQFLVMRALRSLVRTQVGGAQSLELVHELTRQIDQE